MKLEQAQKEQEVLPPERLDGLPPGRVFRYHWMTYEDALREEEFYMVLQEPSKADRVMVANTSTGMVKMHDKELRVYEHTAICGMFK
jgi:hypothetical protein